MPSEPRTEAAIRGEIAAERDGLVSALTDLRTSLKSKRTQATAVGGAVAAGIVATAAVKLARRLRRG